MSKNTIIVVVITLLLVAGGYWYYSTGTTGNQAPLTSTTPSGSAAEVQFQALVSQLQPITFNTAIFSDPRFAALVDISTVVTSEPSGRIDPFAPIPGVKGM